MTFGCILQTCAIQVLNLKSNVQRLQISSHWRPAFGSRSVTRWIKSAVVPSWIRMAVSGICGNDGMPCTDRLFWFLDHAVPPMLLSRCMSWNTHAQFDLSDFGIVGKMIRVHQYYMQLYFMNDVSYLRQVQFKGFIEEWVDFVLLYTRFPFRQSFFHVNQVDFHIEIQTKIIILSILVYCIKKIRGWPMLARRTHHKV